MKKIRAQTFIEQLQSDTRQVLATLKQLQHLDPDLLLHQPSPGKWSVAQIIEHLNTYGRYYLPKLEKARGRKQLPPFDFFKPGWLGAYFTKSMRPKPNGSITNKMKAFKNHIPDPAIDSKAALDEFEKQELLLLELLNDVTGTDLSKGKVPVSIAPFIKLKMGDVFAFLIAHHQRHFVQINNTLNSIRAHRPVRLS